VTTKKDRGDQRKQNDDDQRKWQYKTFFHIFGHFSCRMIPYIEHGGRGTANGLPNDFL